MTLTPQVGSSCTPSYVVLRHSYRVSKLQHYELYALPGSPQTTVFDAATLPNGVKHAFSLADAMEVDVETAEAAAAGARGGGGE